MPADELERDEGGGTNQTPTDNGQVIPGAIPDGLAATIPDWYRVGWRAVGGIDNHPATERDEIDKNILAGFIKEQYYGQWYHNAGIIFFVCYACPLPIIRVC